MIRSRSPLRTPGTRVDAPKPMWMISFTDLVSLLLGFFVMLYAMTEPSKERWERLAKGMSARSQATTYSERRPVPMAAFNGALIESHSRVGLDYLGVLLRSQIRQDADLGRVDVRNEGDRLVVSIPGDILFEGESRVVGDGGRRILYLLGSVIGRIGHRIEIVAETVQGSDGSGPVWELALARSVIVAATLRDTGYRPDLVARAAVPVAGKTARPNIDIVVREQEG